MKEILPIAKLGDDILVIKTDDLNKIGGENALDVKCVEIDLNNQIIREVVELEKHLKFNPWEEISEDQRDHFLSQVLEMFSQDEINTKIIEAL